MDEKTGVASSYRFHAGWSGTAELPDRPDMIEMSLDKDTYKPGEKAVLSIVPPFDGELAVVALDENSFHQVFRGKASKKGTRIDIHLDKKILQKSGIYLMATVFRPGDVKSEKISGRAIGLIWVDAKGSMPKIDISLKVPDVIQPEKSFEARVCLNKSRKNLHMRIAVVDEAILQLTEFKTPDPFDYIFDQTKLAYTIRDSYGQLINPFGTRPGDFKVGGDSLQQKALAKLAVRTFKTVSLVSNIISEFSESKEEGCAQTAKVSFKLPDFSGQVRVMAVAWNDEATGSTESSVVVREPLETYIALPRFLAPEDKTTLTMDAQNLTGAEATFKVTLRTEGEISLVKEFSQTLKLSKNQMVHLPVEVLAKQVGIGKLYIHIEGPQGLVLDKNWEIAIRSPVFEMTRQSSGVLKPAETLSLDASSLAKFRLDTGKVEISIGSQPSFGANRLRKELKGYPYACLEQLTSRLVAELYTGQENRDASKIMEIITQLVSLQQFDGTFGLWSANAVSEPWLSLYAIDLLNTSRRDKFEAGQVPLKRGMEWLKEKVRENSDNISVKAYAHYILAKEGLGTLGALKYFADNSQEQLKHRDDLALVAAAFALYGDAKSAEIWFNKAIAAQQATDEKDRNFFQSWISESAILVTVMSETIQNHPKLLDLALQLADQASQPEQLSTFEKGWLIRAAQALSKLAKPFTFTLNEETIKETKSFSRSFSAEMLKSKVLLKNEETTALNYTLTATGEPLDLSALPNKGFKLTRELYTLNGQFIEEAEVKSGDLLVVVLKGELLEKNTHEVMILDLLPAGFEIETVKFDESFLKRVMTESCVWDH